MKNICAKSSEFIGGDPKVDKLRAICHSLKMQNFNNLDENCFVDIKSRIKCLPSAEEILKYSDEDLKELRNRVENLLFDIDRADNQRTKGYCLRHKVNKKMPPRRPPVLNKNWYNVYKSGNLGKN